MVTKKKENTMTGLELVTAFITLFPHSPARSCIIERREYIAQTLEASRTSYPEMPIEMIATIGFMETHLGCDRGEGGNWGAPVSAQQRHVAGTPLQAARVLWRSYEVCHTWEGAARRFRTGLCHATATGTPYARNAISISNRIQVEVERNRENSNRVCRALRPRVCG